jgi:hypothetical protein
MSLVNLEGARRLADKIKDSPEQIEYVCRAALLLLDIEPLILQDDNEERPTQCPVCGANDPLRLGHQWQCDLKGALDMMEEMSK